MEILQTNFLGNALEQWLMALAWAVGGIIVARLAYKIVGRIARKVSAKTRSNLDDLIVDKLEEPLVLALTIIALRTGYGELTFGDGVDTFIDSAMKVAYALNITWGIARLVDAVILNFFVPFTLKKESAMMDQFGPILRKGLRSGIWVFGLIMALNNAGYDVGALIAGVGIGGLALAMAAKDFVSNMFGGITVFVDQPFKVGDRIQISGYDGTIEEIGLRSTRLRTLAGRLVIIPNFKFTDSFLENVAVEPSRKVSLTLGLTYDTTPEQVEAAIGILKAIVAERQDTLEADPTIWFDSFGDFSLNVKMVYYIKKAGHWAYSPSEVNLEILKRFNAAGLDFAFPTQTLLTPDVASTS
ncbi:MAG: mechanosensitive ion channel family protein [Flavobacteriales bacterium]|nr:mechanosensitive ion channel family protein [Flavobacteriales bacterium]